MKIQLIKKMVYILFVLFLTLFSSCFSQKINKKYYEIYYNTKKSEVKTLPYVIRVKRFSIDKIYDRYNIVNRTSAYELEYSKSQFWAVKPERMIADLITNQLKISNMFKDVTIKYDKIPDLLLSGRILVLDNIKSEKDVFARISVELKIFDFKTNKTLVSYRFERRKKIVNKSMVYVAREMSNILQEEIDKFLIEAYDKLSKK